MFLSTAEEIQSAVRRLIYESNDGSPIRIAVAFWGAGAEALIPDGKRYNLLCNLSTGSTNPMTLRQLAARHQTRHLSDLHAKVLVGQTFALVGSANLSSAGLGFAGGRNVQWREAMMLIPRSSPEFQAIREWFFLQWAEADPVNEAALALAEAAWNARAQVQVPFAAAPSERAVPQLSEDLMFASGFVVGDNRIRMAARWIVEIYDEALEAKNRSNVRIPAFAANILWTLSGQSVETQIEDVPRFHLPDQVINRALERGQPHNNLERIARLMRALLVAPQTPDAVKFWITRWLNRTSSNGVAI